MDEFLSEREDGLSEIQKWIEDRMPEIVKDLTRICRIRSVAETEAVPYPPYGRAAWRFWKRCCIWVKKMVFLPGTMIIM